VAEMKELRRDQRGAVLAEFVIAIVPILITFFSFVQLSKIATARLVMKHGAIVAARAAAVMTNAHKNTPDQDEGDHQGEITQGARLAMAPWVKDGSLTAVDVRVDDQSSQRDPYGWVHVEVTAIYRCRVPLGQLICAGRTKVMTERYSMPHQGATYEM
jgi:Flp pilus assembly protein TadG